jgi:hypothetical protein
MPPTNKIAAAAAVMPFLISIPPDVGSLMSMALAAFGSPGARRIIPDRRYIHTVDLPASRSSHIGQSSSEGME